MKRCVLALLALALCNLLFHGTAQAAPKQAASDAVRVAVLPFQINGGADLNYLNDELPKLFEQRLAQKGFKVIPAKDTLRLLKNQQISQLNLATARSIARQAGANYAVYGSFSKTGDAFSIDARMVDAAGQQGAQPYFVQKQNMIELLPAVDELVDKMGGGAVKGDAITDIQIRGVKVLDPDVVLMRLSTRKGDVVDPSTLNEEIKRIWDLGYFSDVNAPMASLLPRRREPGGGAAAVQDALEIGKDFGVIENEGGQGFHRIEGDLRGVVPGAELFGIQGFGDKHGGDGVLAGIAVGCGIHAEQPGQPHTQIGLLKGFADGGLLGGLAQIDEAARQGVAVGRILAVHQHEPALTIMDHDVHGRLGIQIFFNDRAAFRTGQFSLHHQSLE